MAFSLSFWEWVLASLVVIIGALVQGSIGFGVALLGAPLLFLINPMLVPAPVIIIGMSLPLLILLRDHHAVVYRDVAWVLPGKLLGSLMAAALLGVVSESALGLVFGALVLLGVGLSLSRRFPLPGGRHLFAAGGVAGFMATTTSIGGPPLALVFQHVRGARLRGTLSACFIPGGIFSLAALWWVGRLGWSELMAGLSLFPAIISGFLLSAYLAHWLDRGWLRPALLAVSALAGLTAVVNAAWQLLS
ncbi:putative membrane protein YfcA [Natronospira proteinivora]|uniref:Probable membrane transporter protein n=1 Tax=Natronospira proteinivora TaxID=1807133 RepID=A0ABT1GCM5_9GAMM|nr:sulfite exporter TauE/SafE family protein [Natronospira proteinivora]MCP1728033.1 putative membrane protein YfcA [Natronospira proteinivora]